MKTRLILCSAIFFLSANVYAQQTDKKAETILNGVSQKYRSFKTVKATFVITVENPQDKNTDRQKGTICLKGDKYRLNVAGQDVVSDGVTTWTYIKDANEVQINKVKKDENAITPANIFTMYEKGWLFKFTGEQTEKGMVYQLVELVPVDPKKKNIFKVKLKINKNDKFITTAKVFDKNGSISTFVIDKLNTNNAASDTVFTFNKNNYPGAEINDLR